MDELRADLFRRSLDDSYKEESSLIIQKLVGEKEERQEYIHL